MLNQGTRRNKDEYSGLSPIIACKCRCLRIKLFAFAALYGPRLCCTKLPHSTSPHPQPYPYKDMLNPPVSGLFAVVVVGVPVALNNTTSAILTFPTSYPNVPLMVKVDPSYANPITDVAACVIDTPSSRYRDPDALPSSPGATTRLKSSSRSAAVVLAPSERRGRMAPPLMYTGI